MAKLTILLRSLNQTGAVAAKWLARGDRLADAMPGRDAMLRECFQFIGTQIPVAALTHTLDARDAPGATWLRADPCYVAVDAVTVRMLACEIADLSTEESNELAQALRPLFGDAGFPLEAASPARWYLRCPANVQLPRFSAPHDVLGDDLMPHLPSGSNARQWRHLLNEAQVILHNHPVNAQRMQRGQLPANSLWFWGAGVLPEWVRSPFTHVDSNDEVMIALARLAKVPASLRQPDCLVQLQHGGNVLLDVADLRDPAALQSDWLLPIAKLMQQRKLTRVQVHAQSGERVVLEPWHRWRFWRHVLPA